MRHGNADQERERAPRDHNLAKAISDCGWGMFITMLSYKADRVGKIYIEVDRFFPSCKTYNVGLNQVGSLPLDVRKWTCENCQTTHDRDINAAINVKNVGEAFPKGSFGDIGVRN